jgi:AmmeMemoRadiSam system protein B
VFARHSTGAVRPPAVAGSFYPRDPGELRTTVARLLIEGAPARQPEKLIGVVAPHAGYIYSGPVAGKAFASIAAAPARFSRALLIGPAHYAPVHGVSAPSALTFTTPLGDIPVDREAVEKLHDAQLVAVDDLPHAPEHSLEVDLPFLQFLLENFAIVPLLVGDVSPEQVAAIIEAVLDERTLLVVSTDLSHYLNDAAARKRDLATAEAIEARDFAKLTSEDACGYRALNGALCTASRRNWRVNRLKLANSGETSGDHSRVVGYGAWEITSVEA